MNFKHSKNIQSGHDGISKVFASSWSQNNMRLAIAQSDRKIALYDENGEKREAFSTKPFKVKKRKRFKFIFILGIKKLHNQRHRFFPRFNKISCSPIRLHNFCIQTRTQLGRQKNNLQQTRTTFRTYLPSLAKE